MRADAAAAVRLPLNALADYHVSVNYRPARRKCLPVLAPAQAFVRAGAGRRGQFGMRNAELGRGGCARPAMRSCRGGCPRHAPGDAFLLRRLPFVYACPRVSVAAIALGIRPAIVSVTVVCFGIRLSFQVCCGVCLRYAPGDAFLSLRFALGTRLLFAAWRQTGRLAQSSVSVPRGSRSPLVRSPMFCGYRTLWVHFGLVRFLGRSRRRPRRSPGGDRKASWGRTSIEQKPYHCAVTCKADAIRRNRVANLSCSSGAVIAHSI